MKPVPVNEVKVGEVYRYGLGRSIGYGDRVGQKFVITHAEPGVFLPYSATFFYEPGRNLPIYADEIYPCRVRTGNKWTKRIEERIEDHINAYGFKDAMGILITMARIVHHGYFKPFDMKRMTTDEKETLYGFLLCVDDATLKEFLELNRYE